MGVRIIVGLSGGVDSAVTAFLLKFLGFDVKAVFMRNWAEVSPSCNWEWDYESAKMAALHLAIPLELWDFEREYCAQVFEPALASFSKGFTPNPDIVCNKMIKFGAFLDRARAQGARWIATGHYARIKNRASAAGCKVSLLTGIDQTKDQSYFLSTLSQQQLASCLFPLGSLSKLTVRTLARHVKLPNAQKKDSYGMCFIGEQPLKTFLRSRLRAESGPIFTTEGDFLGMHEGLAFYTIGQRKGIHIRGSGPYYVASKDTAHNTLIVAHGPNHPALFTQSLTLPAVHWIEEPPAFPFLCYIRHRHLQPLQAATAARDANAHLVIQFMEPQRAITPGQFLAIYGRDKETCFGGGTIMGV